jgi:uncharacterized protein YhjY with autotransporter beta-barrel domain
MQQQSVVRTRSSRFAIFFRAQWLLFAILLWPTLASAQVSPYCPTQSMTVANGGSVTSINLAACDGPFNFGMGGPFAPFLPANGSVVLSSQSGPGNQTVTYTHNGTATTTDTFALEDENGDELTFNVTITPPTSAIIVSPASLPTLTAGTSFSQTLTSTGGAAPYTYTLSGGTLPTGLTLSAAGVLSGTPTQRGGYAFGVRSQDNVGAFVIKGYTGTVQNPSLSLATPSATAVQGAPFSLSLAVNGGVAPHSFQHEVVAGPLPPGISLSAAGVLSGTPTTLGTTNFQMRVTDASTGLGSYFELENYSFTVVAPPSVSIAVAPASVSEDGATNLVYTVTRSLNLSSPTVVNITTGGTATSGTDYTGGVATVSIPAGATTATITINPTADAGFEADETVILTVAAGSGYTVGAPASATGTILNDDVLSASITVAPASVSEDGAANLVYTVTLSQAPLVAIAVNFTVTGTATSGTDYAAVTSPVTIAAGATTGTVTVNPAADATIETNETVILTLNAGTGYTVGAPASATGTILNDDLPTLTINDVTVNEGNAGTTNFTFTVSLSAPAGPGGVTFDIATANGTASAGVDYVANSLTGQTIPAGNSTYSFTVLVNGDTLSEPNKTFFVNVTNVTNAVVGDAQGVGTITNDDPAPSLSINDVTVTEGNAGTVNAVFTVTLSAASGQTVTVNYATADGTATQPADYTNTSGTLTFTPGATTQTITVPVIGETVPEANETFFVNLSGAVNATIADNQGVGTITNDDVPVTVNPATIPNATVATAYSQTLTASGGTAPYGFAVTAGALPAGLTLSSGGILSGTSTAGGTFNFTVTATDSSGLPGPFSGSRAYTLVVNPATVVLPATPLAGGTLGAAYSAAITPASGGTAPYTYAVTAGALPGGLTLNAATGAITGTPSALGTFNFAITATDSSTGSGPYSSAPRGYSIVVLDNPPVTNSGTLTVAYNAAATPVPLNITGGTPTSVAIASTPTTGTAIATGTTITYQPAAGFAGSDSFTYTASNSGGTSVPATVTVTVSEPVITITAGGSLAATVAVAYTQTFTWSGGAQPWSSYQVTNLPAGVSITGTTANTVTISGTPTQAGSFNLNVSATDSSTGNGPYSVGEAFTLTVAGPTLALAPAGTTFTAPYNVAYSQSFTASGGVGPYTYARTGTLPPDLSFAGNTVSGTPATPGSYSFTITATDTGATGTGAPFTVAQNYTITVAAPTIAVNPATLPNPTAGAAYSQTLTATGGAAPYTFALTAGALPNGIALASGGALSGTSTVVGTYTFTATATDGNGQTGSRAYTVTIAAPTLTMTPAAGTLTAPYGAAYTQTFTASGGSNTFSHTLSGALPAGLSFSGNTITAHLTMTPAAAPPPYTPFGLEQPCTAAGLSFSGNTITGTPTVPGNYPITVTATDTVLTGTGAPFSIAQNYTLNVPAPAVAVNPATLPNPTAGAAYSQTLTATGGAAPYTFALTAGALPNGIALASGGALSGTSTVVGTYTFTATATDGNGQTGSRAYTVTIAAPTLTMTPAAGTLTAPYGAAYTQTFTASGGSNTFSHTLSGALPAGLSFSGNTITGTPTVPGNYPITVTATDTVLTGTGAPFSIAQNYTLNVPAPAVAVNPATLPNPTAGAAYSQTLTATGGSAPYTFALTAGALPNGIALASGGALSGTSTVVGTYTFTATATDGNGQTGSRAYTVTIAAPTLTMTPAAGTLTAPYGAAYTQTFTASGGSNTFSHTLSGALPAGLSFSGNTITGTPTVPGNYPITVTATDTVLTGTGAPFSIAQNYTLNVPAPAVAVNPATLPNPTAGAAYSQTLTATGGAAPYTFALTAGALPNGIALASGGALSGTSTVVGTYTFTATATDGNGQTGSRAYTVTIAAPTLTMTPAAGTLTAPYGAAYTQTFTASGGSNTFSHTLSGALPAGLSFSGNTITGTPTVPGNYPITVTATDTVLTGTGAPFSIAQNYTLNVPAPAVAVNPATLPNPTAGAAYSQTLTATGGAAPYTFALTAGALPNGIALASGGALSGTSTASGTFAFTIAATDANGQMGDRAYTLVVAVPTLAVTPVTLPAGTAGTAYSQTLTISGGIAPYTAALSGVLPAGLTFNAATRSFSGTPTQSGTFNISVTVTDSTGGTAATITTPYTLSIAAPSLTLTPATVPSGTGGVAYAQMFSASGGIAPYSYTVSAGALPQGLTLNASTGALAGTPSVAGSFNFSITGKDSTTGAAGSVTQAYTLPVSAPAITLTPETLPAGLFAVSYPLQLTAVGGTAPYRYAVTSGALPAGLTLSNQGLFTGAPNAAGTFTVTITVTDALNFTGLRVYTLTVAPRPDPALDPEVRGLLNAQSEAAHRFATSQIGNFQQRMQRLHGRGAGTGFSNMLSASARSPCNREIGSLFGNHCDANRQQPFDGDATSQSNAATADRVAADASASPLGIWTAGTLRSGGFDNRVGTVDLDFETDGVSFGADYRVSDHVVVGLGAGYGRDRTHVGNNGSRSDATAYSLAAYTSISPTDRFFIDALFGYQTLDFDLRRHVTADGSQVMGSRKGSQWFGSVSTGADLALKAWQFTPYLRVDAAHGELDGYREQSNSPYALQYGAMDVESLTGNVGVRFDYRQRTTWGSFSPQLNTEYQHDFSGNGLATMQYNDLLRLPFYRSELDGYSRSRWLLGAGMQFNWDSGWGLRVDYRTLVGGSSTDHGLQLYLDAKF